jgi:hypothetical protein
MTISPCQNAPPQEGREEHRSRRTGHPPTERAQSRPVGVGRQAQNQQQGEREKGDDEHGEVAEMPCGGQG